MQATSNSNKPFPVNALEREIKARFSRKIRVEVEKPITTFGLDLIASIDGNTWSKFDRTYQMRINLTDTMLKSSNYSELLRISGAVGDSIFNHIYYNSSMYDHCKDHPTEAARLLRTSIINFLKKSARSRYYKLVSFFRGNEQ